MGNIEGRSSRAFTIPAGLEVQVGAVPGGNRQDLNLIDAGLGGESIVPSSRIDVVDNVGQLRADVRVRLNHLVRLSRTYHDLLGGPGSSVIYDPTGSLITLAQVVEVWVRPLSIAGLVTPPSLSLQVSSPQDVVATFAVGATVGQVRREKAITNSRVVDLANPLVLVLSTAANATNFQAEVTVLGRGLPPF